MDAGEVGADFAYCFHPRRSPCLANFGKLRHGDDFDFTGILLNANMLEAYPGLPSHPPFP